MGALSFESAMPWHRCPVVAFALIPPRTEQASLEKRNGRSRRGRIRDRNRQRLRRAREDLQILYRFGEVGDGVHRHPAHSDGLLPGLTPPRAASVARRPPARHVKPGRHGGNRGCLMKIAIVAEVDPAEPRVAATPDTVKKILALGAQVAVEPGAGLKSGVLDADYAAAGATVAADAARGADVVLKVRRPAESELASYKQGALVIAIMDPYGNEAALAAMARAGVTAFAMELMPRITRAQVMDVLSSQANLAGYRAVVDAAAEYGRALPMMMTAAGTVPATRVFVMGVGVAGLQAIATARRMGAVVTATDVRPATKEQVESLGAKFVAVEDDEFKQAQTASGYAKEMSKDYQAKQAALTASHITKQDIVITTALIPGRPAPRLISAEMVYSMRPGSV